jgi:TolA-binding protein
MLRSQKHLTKKEMKKDPFLIFIAESYDFLQREWLKITGLVGGVIVLAAAVLLATSLMHQSERNAYDSTMNAYYSNAPESIELMSRFVDEHGNSVEAAKVTLQLANYYLTQKDLVNAEKYYRIGMDSNPGDQIFAFNAYSGLGAVQEEQGNFEQAGKTYESFITRYQGSSFTESMLFKAGTAYYRAGNTASAQRSFQAVLDSGRDSSLKPEARYYLALMSS